MQFAVRKSVFLSAGGEYDMRFVFCAAAITALLPKQADSADRVQEDDKTGKKAKDEKDKETDGELDLEQLVEYVRLSQNYDGGIGLGPGLESHGGSTYCAVAALALFGVPLLDTPENGKKNGLFEPFIYKSHLFAKTGSGQT